MGRGARSDKWDSYRGEEKVEPEIQKRYGHGIAYLRNPKSQTTNTRAKNNL